MDVERRLRRLERTNLGLVGVIALGGLMAASRGVPDEVRARRFVVEDARGVERASLGSRENGEATLNFEGQKDVPAIALGIRKEGLPYMRMNIPGQEGGMTLGFTRDGKAFAYLGDGDGKEHVNISPFFKGPGLPAGPGSRTGGAARPRSR